MDVALVENVSSGSVEGSVEHDVQGYFARDAHVYGTAHHPHNSSARNHCRVLTYHHALPHSFGRDFCAQCACRAWKPHLEVGRTRSIPAPRHFCGVRAGCESCRHHPIYSKSPVRNVLVLLDVCSPRSTSLTLYTFRCDHDCSEHRKSLGVAARVTSFLESEVVKRPL